MILNDKTAIIDGDIIPYIVGYRAYKHDYDIQRTKQEVDNFLSDIYAATSCDKYIIALKAEKNFRKSINKDYKANRKKALKIKYKKEIIQYLKSYYGCLSLNPFEADDVCACIAHSLNYQNTVIVHTDKDLDQIKGLHYNPLKNNHYEVQGFGTISLQKKGKKAKLNATGDLMLLSQLLMGDPVDNIKGVPRIGPVKTYKLLKDCNSLHDGLQIVIKEYKKYFDDKEQCGITEFYKNYLMCYIMKYKLDKIPEATRFIDKFMVNE